MKILIVDDDPELNLMLTRRLEREGYEVHSAGDALQALDLMERVADVGMIITDLMMPYIDGLQLLDRLRADERFKSLPVIMTTAHPDDAKADQSLRKGAAFFLPKPIDFDRLLAIVKFAE